MFRTLLCLLTFLLLTACGGDAAQPATPPAPPPVATAPAATETPVAALDPAAVPPTYDPGAETIAEGDAGSHDARTEAPAPTSGAEETKKAATPGVQASPAK